jgi:hypothetical protein
MRALKLTALHGEFITKHCAQEAVGFSLDTHRGFLYYDISFLLCRYFMKPRMSCAI